MHEKGITSYEDCLDKLKNAYSKLNKSIDGEVDKIVSAATSGEIDINHYLPGNKIREGAFNSLLGADFDITNMKEYDKVCDIYEKGLTTTINQADSDFGKQSIMRYKPKNLAELIGVSLKKEDLEKETELANDSNVPCLKLLIQDNLAD